VAVTKETLAISVEVDTSDFNKWSKDIDESFGRISEATEESNAKFEKIRSTLDFVKNNLAELATTAKSLFELVAATKAFAETLEVAGESVQWLGNRVTETLGSESFLRKSIKIVSSGFADIAVILHKYSISLSNFAVSIRLYTYNLSKMGDPKIVKLFYQSIGLITPLLDGISDALDFAGTSIARFGVAVKNLEGFINTSANKMAYFVISTSRGMNTFGQALYKTGISLALFTIKYVQFYKKIFDNDIFAVLNFASFAFNPFDKYVRIAIGSLLAFGIAVGTTALSLIKLGPALAKAGLGFFQTIDSIDQARKFFIGFTQSLGKGLLDAGLFIQRFGIDIANISGRLKIFSMSFKERDSSIMLAFAKGLALAFAPLVQKIDGISSGMANMAGIIARAGQSIKGFLPYIGELSGTFRLTGTVINLFGKTFSGFGKDAKNIVSILTEVQNTQIPFLKNMNAISNTVAASAGGFASLGLALLQSDSAAGKFAGGAALALAVSIGGVLSVTKAATAAIGDFVTNAGIKLFTFFDAGIQLAAEDEEATVKFTRAITRLSGSFEDAQKNISVWNKALVEIQKNSSVTESDSQAFASAIAKLGQELSLTTDQQIKLAKNISVFSLGQEELFKTTEAVRLALLGNGRAAEELGIHLNDAAINTGEYSDTIGKTVDAMSDQEKVTARLIAINSQAQKAQESFASTGESLIAVSRRIKVSQEEISAAFAKSSIPVYKFFTSIQVSLLKAIEGISQPIKNAIANIVAYSGAALIVVGLTVKWGFTIGILATAIAQLNTLIKVSAGLQALLTTAFTLTNTAVNQQVIAITGLSSVLVNLANFTKGLVIASLTALGNALLAVGRTIMMVTTAILSSPIFWKSVAVVTAISAIINAVDKLSDKSLFLQRIFSKTTQDIDGATDKIAKNTSIWQTFGKILDNLFDKIVALAEVMIGGLLGSVNLVAMAFVKIRSIFADNEDAEAYGLMMEQLSDELGDTSKNLQEATNRLLDFGGKAFAATGPSNAMSDGIEKIGKSSQNTATKLEQMTDRIVKSFNVQRERLKVLGDDYDRANISIIEAQEALTKASSMPKDNNEKAKALAEARINRLMQEIELEKKRADTIKAIDEQRRSMEIEQLKRSGQNIPAINAEFKEKIQAIQEEEKGLKKIGQLRLEDQIVINQTIRALKSAKAAAIDEEKVQSFEKIQSIQDKITEIQKDNLAASRNEIDAINAKVADRVRELESLKKTFKAQSEIKKEALQLLEIGKQIAINNGSAAVERKRAEFLRAATDETRKMAASYADMNALGLEAIRNQNKETLIAIENKRREAAIQGLLTQEVSAQYDRQKSLADDVMNRQIDMASRSYTLFGDFFQDFKSYYAMIRDLSEVSFSTMFNGLENILQNSIKLLDQFISKTRDAGKSPEQNPNFVGPPSAAKQAQPGLISSMVSKATEYGGQAVESVSSAAANMIPESVMNIGSQLGSVVSSMGNMISMLVKVIMNLPQMILDFIDGITSAIEGLLLFPLKLVSALTNLDAMLQKFIDEFPSAVQDAMQKVPALLVSIAEKIPDFLITLIEQIPKITEHLAAVVPVILVKIVQALPRVFAAFIKASLNFWIGLIKGLFKGLMSVFNGSKGFKAPDIKVDGKQAAKTIAQLTKDTNKLFSVNAMEEASKAAVIKNPTASIEQAGKKSANWLTEAWNKTIGWLRDVWLWIYDRIIMPLVMGLRQVWIWIYDKVIMPLVMGLRQVWLWLYDSVIMPLLNGLRAVWQWIYDSVIMPIVNGLQAVWQWIYDSVIMPILSGLQAVWNGILEVVMSVFSGIGEGLKALFDGVGAIFSGIWKAGGELFSAIPEIFAGIWRAATAVFSAVPQIFSKIWSAFEGVFGRLGDIGQTIISSITNGIGSIGKSISGLFSGFGKMFSSLFKFDTSGITKAIGEAFDAAGAVLKNAFAAVINPYVDIFNGLIGVLNNFKIPALSIGVPKWAGGGKWNIWGEIDLIPIEIGKIPRFAQGGLVQGPGGTDNVPAMLTAGEFVMRRPAVEALGLPTLRALNRGQAPGGDVTQHFTFNLKIESKDKVDETFIKQRLMPAIREELRRGSLDGRAVVYAGGVRA
jgi:phage-related protein